MAPTQRRRDPISPAHGVGAERVVSSSRYLTLEERLYIADQVWAKAPVRRIAENLERSPSTISRETRRNCHPANGQYRRHAAQAREDRSEPGAVGVHTEASLTRSLTRDQGSEMGRHHEFTLAVDVPVYFCDPASPWQRGSNENTNGLLRDADSDQVTSGAAIQTATPIKLEANK